MREGGRKEREREREGGRKRGGKGRGREERGKEERGREKKMRQTKDMRAVMKKIFINKMQIGLTNDYVHVFVLGVMHTQLKCVMRFETSGNMQITFDAMCRVCFIKGLRL